MEMRRLPLTLLYLLLATPILAQDLITAIHQHDYHRIRTMLADDPASVSRADPRGFTALHWAGILDEPLLVAQLLDARAPLDILGGDGGSPLHWLCHHDHPDLARRMIDAGAAVEVANRWGRTPLHVAVRRGCRETVIVLLLSGAVPGATTREGWTTLHTARMAGRPELATLLLRAGADPEAVDQDGKTARDLSWVRPIPQHRSIDELSAYTGSYDLGHGMSIDVWLDGDELAVSEFAPDHLEPAAGDTFWCRAEPWRLVFSRDGSGSVDGVEVKYLRRTVTAERADTPRFVGSQRCRQCHQDEAMAWLSGRHAAAYWRLATDWALVLGRMRPHYQDLEEPTADPRCRQCHLTGAGEPWYLPAPGFRIQEGVGCEACHGPGSSYIAEDVMTDHEAFLAAGGRVPDAATCQKCHRRDFTWEEKWPRIAHGHQGD